MKVFICFIAILYMAIPPFSLAEDKGSVCLGPFLSIILYQPSNRPYLTIGDYGPFHFEQSSQPCRLVAGGLDLKKVYKVRVHFEGKVVTSWNLNFEKMGSNMVYIWRDKGAWRMEPIRNGKCERPRR